MKNKILIVVLILLALTVYGVSKAPRNQIINASSSNTGIVAFGDSLTYGTGSSAGGGYVKMLSTDIGIPITNLGIAGNTTEDALVRIDQVVQRRPKVTIVLLGGNDFLQNVPEDRIFSNLGLIIGAIERTGSSVVLVGLEPQVSGDGERKKFDKLAAQYHTAYVPNILDGIYGHLDMMSDNLHPNDAGYRIMADRIRPVLEGLLK